MCTGGKTLKKNPRNDDIKPKHINVRPYKREKYNFQKDEDQFLIQYITN